MKRGFGYGVMALCIVMGPCPFVFASSLDAPLSQYDDDLLRLCLQGKVYERAAAIEVMGRILSPGLSRCLRSLPEDVLEEPLLLSSIMRAIKTGGISGDDDLKSHLIAKGLCSKDPFVTEDAMWALRLSRSRLPFDAFWPPDKAPLVWGNPVRSRTVAPFLKDIDTETAAADPAWEKFPTSLLSNYREGRGHPFRLSDYPLEIQLEISVRSPGRENNKILRRIACSGRQDLVLPHIRDIVEKADLPASDFRKVAPLLPDSMLFETLHYCPRTLIPVLAGECARRGLPLSPLQLKGCEELPGGGKIPPSSVDFRTLLELTLSAGNWEYFEKQLDRRRSGDTTAVEWNTLYSVAFLAEPPSPEVRNRILASLTEEIQAEILPEQTRKVPPALLYPRLLSGLLSGFVERRARWNRWLMGAKPFQDAEEILFFIGGRDGFATSLKRFLGRGLAENWLPADTPCPMGIVEKLSRVQPPGDDIAGIALEPGFPPLLYPPAVLAPRSAFGKAVLKGYGDPSNPRLAKDFLINRLGKGDYGFLRLEQLAEDSRPIVSLFASRLLRRIPETGYEPFFVKESSQNRKLDVAHQVHILELLARLYRGLDRCMMKSERNTIRCGITPFGKPLAIGYEPDQLLQAFHPEIIENFKDLAALGPTRRVRHAAQWALWTAERDEGIPGDWIREAQGTNEARALEALDLLLASRYRPAEKVFSSLIEDSRDTFIEKGLDGALVFSFNVPIHKLSVLAHHHNLKIARRAMLVLGKRQSGLDVLLKLVIDEKPYTQRYAAEALRFFHSGKDIDRIAAALKECVAHEENCRFLFLAADRASYRLGAGSPGLSPGSGRAGPSTFRRISLWLDWWRNQHEKSLSHRVEEAFRIGLEGLGSQDKAESLSARFLLGLFVPIIVGEERRDEIDAARTWYELGPADDVFVWLSGAERHSFLSNSELLRALDERRTRNLVLRMILRRTALPLGEDARNPLVAELLHENPDPFVGSCEQRAHNAEIWFRHVLDTGAPQSRNLP